METIKRFMSYQELSEEVGININTLYSMVKKKKIPHQRLSLRLVRFDRIEIDKWLDETKVNHN